MAFEQLLEWTPPTGPNGSRMPCAGWRDRYAQSGELTEDDLGIAAC